MIMLCLKANMYDLISFDPRTLKYSLLEDDLQKNHLYYHSANYEIHEIFIIC